MRNVAWSCLNGSLWSFLLLQAGCAELSFPQPNVPVPAGPFPVRMSNASSPGNGGIQLVGLQAPGDPASQPRPADLPTPRPASLPLERVSVLNAEAVVEQVLARNPTLAQMSAAWQAASARYPQVTSLDDPNFGFTMAPASIGSNAVDFGYRVEVSQRLPFPGKLNLRGENALAEASAADRDVADVRLQLIESARNAFYDYYLVHRSLVVNEENLTLLKRARKSAEDRIRTAKANRQEVLQIDVELGRQRERGLTLERMKKVTAARINTLMHLPPNMPLPPPPEKIAFAPPLPPIEVLTSLAVAQRPDLQAISDRIVAEQAMLALAVREYCPDFEGSVAYDTIMGNGPARDLAPQLALRMNLPVRLTKLPPGNWLSC